MATFQRTQDQLDRSAEHLEKKGIRLLSLDGGAIRGISILLILRALMQQIQQKERLAQLPKPCEQFDMIGGTNTGGIIAILLGRLKMDVETAMKHYTALVDTVYSDGKRPWSKELFKSTTLQQALKNLVKRVTRNENTFLQEQSVRKSGCRVFVCARSQVNLNANIPVLFRSYPSVDSHLDSSTIWEAAHATCATPGVFKPIVVGKGQAYIDGGLGNNNPVKLVLSEAAKQFPGRMVALVASIGTGHPETIQLIRPSSMTSTLMSMATDCEDKHNDMVQYFSQVDNLYFRFSVEQGIQATSTVQVSQSPDVEAHTEAYLRTNPTTQRLSDAAEEIVKKSAKIPVQYLVSVPGGMRLADADAYLRDLQLSLSSKLAINFGYHHQGKQECHPATRNKILRELDRWMRKSDSRSPCWWITGIAGVGKSAVAMTAVECLLDRRVIQATNTSSRIVPDIEAPLLCAQYFFNHTLDSAPLNRFLPSLASQLARLSPIAAALIHDALQSRPGLVNRFGLEQAERLFLTPLIEVAKVYAPSSVVVIIDGVDELNPPKGDTRPTALTELTTVFSTLALSLPSNVRLLFLSRPETQIINNLPPHIHRVYLDTSESKRDVNNLLHAELRKLGDVHQLADFPTPSQLHRLSMTADGHLGWAKQAIQWLASLLEYEGGDVVNTVIEEVGLLATGDLDSLYYLILSRLPPPMGTLVVKTLEKRLPIRTVSKLVTIKDFDVLHCLKRLSTVYAVGTARITDETSPQPHKSFHDFLVAPERAHEFAVNVPSARTFLARSCFRAMQSDLLHFNMGNKRGDIDEHLRYACLSVFHHLNPPFLRSQELVAEAEEWLSEKFVHWLEVMTLLEVKLSEQEKKLNVLHAACHSSPRISSLIESGHQFMNLWNQHNYDSVKSSPQRLTREMILQRFYMTLLPFRPGGIQLIAPPKRITISSQQDTWLDLEATPHYPCRISPDGNLVAVLRNRLLSILSTETGAVLWHSNFSWMNSTVTFSPDSAFLLVATKSGEWNGPDASIDIHLLNALAGNVETKLHLPVQAQGYYSGIRSVAVSSMGTYFACALEMDARHVDSQVFVHRSADGRCLWTARTTSFVGFLGETSLVMQEDSRILTKSASTGRLLRGFGTVHNQLSNATITSDGRAVLFTFANHIRIQGTSSNSPISTSSVAFPFRVSGASLSPNGQALVVCFTKGHVQVWRHAGWSLFASLENHFQPVSALGLSADGRRLISYSRGIICIRDLSASLEGREFNVQVKGGALVKGSWFRHDILLGGWFTETAQPFCVNYPFDLPLGVKPLLWEIDGH